MNFPKTEREKYQELFLDQTVNFDYPSNIEEFDDLLELYRRRKAHYIENDVGGNILDKLIVMDDISGLADISDEFANFLTVSQKYGLTYVYIFHTIYPTRQNWQMLISQTFQPWKFSTSSQNFFSPFTLSTSHAIFIVSPTPHPPRFCLIFSSIFINLFGAQLYSILSPYRYIKIAIISNTSLIGGMVVVISTSHRESPGSILSSSQPNIFILSQPL